MLSDNYRHLRKKTAGITSGDHVNNLAGFMKTTTAACQIEMISLFSREWGSG